MWQEMKKLYIRSDEQFFREKIRLYRVLTILFPISIIVTFMFNFNISLMFLFFMILMFLDRDYKTKFLLPMKRQYFSDVEYTISSVKIIVKDNKIEAEYTFEEIDGYFQCNYLNINDISFSGPMNFEVIMLTNKNVGIIVKMGN